MTRAKKTLIWLLVVSLLLLIVAYLVGNHLLGRYSRQAMSIIARRGERQGVVIKEPGFDQARISGIRTARWTDLHAVLQFPENEAFDPNRAFEVSVDQVELWLSGGGKVALEAQDIAVNSVGADATKEPPDDENSWHERIHVKRFHCQFEMELFNPLPGLINVLPELVGLMKAGATQIPVVTEGVLEFSLKGKLVKARVQVAQVEGGQTLVLSAEDLQPVSEMFDEAFTDAEIELISTYPLRAAQLFRIKDDAELTAKKAQEHDEQVPQDAYRHVLWSYLLTNKYGASFAQSVTDAHEQGDTGNTPAEREMDLQNNAIGRRYAEQKMRRNQILTHV